MKWQEWMFIPALQLTIQILQIHATGNITTSSNVLNQ